MKLNIKNKATGGFTIVELLVVIVVIGILAAITMVSYSGVTSKANLAANKANASSVMQAADSYFAEFGHYPALADINGGVVKIPTSITTGLIGTIPATGTPDSITYITGTAPATDYCIQYWDTVTAAPAKLASAGTGGAALCLPQA